MCFLLPTMSLGGIVMYRFLTFGMSLVIYMSAGNCASVKQWWCFAAKYYVTIFFPTCHERYESEVHTHRQSRPL